MELFPKLMIALYIIMGVVSLLVGAPLGVIMSVFFILLWLGAGGYFDRPGKPKKKVDMDAYNRNWRERS